MRQVILIATMAFSAFSFGQNIKATNEKISFSQGTQDAIVVNIPYGTKEIIEKELKSEMKDWGGKYDSNKDEFMSKGAKMKAMGDKYFDGYAKIIQKGDEMAVAFAVDLGGAYMNSSDHKEQYKVIEARALKFAKKASSESVEEEIDAETKILSGLEKEQKGLEKDIESSKSDIENYKKKIKEEEDSIEKNTDALGKKKEEVDKQAAKIAEIKKRLK